MTGDPAKGNRSLPDSRFPSAKHLASWAGVCPGNKQSAGKRRAVMAVAHSLLVIMYHVLREKKPYQELGADYFDRLDTEQTQRYYVRRLEQLGYAVELSPAQCAS